MKSSHYVADFSVQYFSISIAKKSYIFRLSKGKGNDINAIANAIALVHARVVPKENAWKNWSGCFCTELSATGRPR